MPDFGLDKAFLKLLALITGEFVGTTDTQTLSNKQLDDLTKVKTTTATAGTQIDVTPTFTTVANTTARSKIKLHNVDDATNDEYLEISANGTNPYQITVNKAGTGSYRNLDIMNFGSAIITVKSNGQVDFHGNVILNPWFEATTSVSFRIFAQDLTHVYSLITGSISADRTATLPDLTGNDKFLFEAQAQTLTKKTYSGMKYLDVSKTANYTLTVDDTIVRADASGGAFTLTLPAASGNTGLTYTIIRTDSAASTNVLTIDGNASETIATQLTYTLAPNEAVTIECDGSNWQVLNSRNKAMSWPGYFRKGSTPNRRYIAGVLNHAVLQTSTTGPTVNTLYAMPFPVVETTKFDTIESEVTTLGSGSNLRMGIYADDSTCYPGALIFDSGNISAASTGAKTATITSSLQVFTPGLYWLTYENSATVPQVRILPATGSYIPILGWGTPFGANLPGYAYTVAHTVGALPNPYTSGATVVTAASAIGAPIPAVALRAI